MEGTAIGRVGSGRRCWIGIGRDGDWKGWIRMGIRRDGDWKDPDVIVGWGLEGTAIGRFGSGWGLEGTAIGKV